MEAELVVPTEIRDQLKIFLRGLSDQQVANMLYIVAEWPKEFIQHCYEYEDNATDRFAKLLRDTEEAL